MFLSRLRKRLKPNGTHRVAQNRAAQDRAAHGRRRTLRPSLEGLESRTLLSITPAAVTITPAETVAFSGTVATFTASDTGPFAATINWGDGSGTTTGTVTAGGGGVFDVTGNHTYAEDGSSPITVVMSDSADSTTATANSTANVLEGNLSGAGATFAATMGSTFSGNVATFSDAGSGATAGSFTATINWGDGGGTSAGTVSGSSGSFTVNGSHLYSDGGAFAAKVLITETGVNPAPAATLAATANVTDTDTLSATSTAIAATEGTSFTGTVATLTDSNISTPASDLTATINWGDGSSSTGTVSGSAGTFVVNATHTYGDEGTFHATVVVADDATGASTSTVTSTATVAQSETLSAGAVTFTTTDGQSFSGTVATFTSTNTAGLAADFTATITWGDGATTTGTVSGTSGVYTVSGTHTYTNDGTRAIGVSIADDAPGTETATAASTANVLEGDLSGTGATFTATMGTTFSGAVATFIDAGSTATAGAFTATIDWGDGSGTSAGTVTGSPGGFTVNGSHLYSDGGAFAPKILITETGVNPAPAATVVAVANVTDTDTLAATGTAIAATEGSTFTGTVATFTDSNTNTPASDMTATVNWGDGSSSTGSVSGSAGSFSVTATHTYGDEGTFHATVVVADDATGAIASTATSTATVAQSETLTAAAVTFTPTAAQSFSGTVATFSSTNTAGVAGDFAATITWGDGATSSGTVSGTSGAYTVSGTHTYSTEGAQAVGVSIADDAPGTETATATSSANVAATNVLAATAVAAIGLTESQTFNGTIATFSDTNLSAASTDFSATIVWGDGGTATGSVTGANGQFTVTANHSYQDEGTLTATTTIVDNATTGATASASTTATISEGDQLLAVATTFAATAGSSFSGNVATFRDNSNFNSASDFSAIINWGDGTTTAGTVSGSGSTFTVSGSHTYLQQGTQGVNVTFFDDAPGTAEVTANSTANIVGQGLTVTAASMSASEGVAFNGTVATFSEPGASTGTSQFTATVNWGDGSSSTGTVTGSGGSYTVAGSHTYAAEGGTTVSVQVTDNSAVPTATASESSTVSVADTDVLTGSGLSITSTEGQAFNGVVATFSDVNAAAAAADFTATINWGDGGSSTGTVAGSAGTFTVSGAHTYAEDGAKAVSVTLADNSPGTAVATASGTAQIADASLSASPVNVTVAQGAAAVNVTVATFTDANTSAPASDFTATIDWGDGSTADQQATVTGSGGTFTVTGSHTYYDPWHYALTVSIHDQGGGTATVSPTAVLGSGNERFAAQLYRDLLGRQGEPQGMGYWENLLSQGTTRTAIVTGFEGSLEFRNDVTQELFQRYLHRAPDPTALVAFSQALITSTPEHDAAILASSVEYFNSRGGGTGNGFLTALFSDALNRPVDAASQLQFGALNLTDPAVRAQVAAQIFGGTEYQTDLLNFPAHVSQPYNTGVPYGFYQTYLHRNADSAGLAANLAEFKAGQNDAQLAAAIIASNEYFANL